MATYEDFHPPSLKFVSWSTSTQPNVATAGFQTIMNASFDDFKKLDIRVGKIVEVEDFPEARKRRKTLLI